MKRTSFVSYGRSLFGLLAAGRARAPLLRMFRKLHPTERLQPATVPVPYRLRPYEPGDEDSWVGLLNGSGEFGLWDRRRLHDEVVGPLLPGGGVFVTVGDELVGCASACFVDEVEPYAILMYVALLPRHRGRGL